MSIQLLYTSHHLPISYPPVSPILLPFFSYPLLLFFPFSLLFTFPSSYSLPFSLYYPFLFLYSFLPSLPSSISLQRLPTFLPSFSSYVLFYHYPSFLPFLSLPIFLLPTLSLFLYPTTAYLPYLHHHLFPTSSLPLPASPCFSLASPPLPQVFHRLACLSLVGLPLIHSSCKLVAAVAWGCHRLCCVADSVVEM